MMMEFGEYLLPIAAFALGTALFALTKFQSRLFDREYDTVISPAQVDNQPLSAEPRTVPIRSFRRLIETVGAVGVIGAILALIQHFLD